MTTIEASWRARWKAIAKYYRALYFAPRHSRLPAGRTAGASNKLLRQLRSDGAADGGTSGRA